jgi:putative ABC transport system permease protein
MSAGRILLVGRLAARDLRRRRIEALLLLLAIVGATTTLTLGLVLHAATDDPYQATREATAGPDVVAGIPPGPNGEPADLAELEDLTGAPGVVDHSGPYPVIAADLEVEADGRTATVQAMGRDTAAAAVDQPATVEGGWVEDGGVVVEAAFADALDLHAGDRVTLDGRSFRVAGIAVTAAIAGGIAPMYSLPAPTEGLGPGQAEGPAGEGSGLVWLTDADVRDLVADDDTLSYVVNLRLSDPATAPAFVDERMPDDLGGPVAPGDPLPPNMQAWQEILDNANNIVRNERNALVAGAWLLGVLAVASVAVLVGGRLADQTRRVGLLKAVGGTPGLVVAVLLAEYVVVALLAAAAGLALGRSVAPLFADPGVGLLGGAGGAPSLDAATVAIVVAVAVGVAAAATLVPAIRASRSSTVRALAGSARPPRRWAGLIALSARLPVPLLLGLRVAARRPRRMVLGIASIAVTVSGIVAAMAAHAQLGEQEGPAAASAFDQLRTDRLNGVLLVITAMLVALAAVNAIFVTWATVLDTRHASALARALGVTPREVSAGLSAAQALPAIVGAVLGIPGGIALFTVVTPDSAPSPPLWALVAVVPATAVAIAALTSVPARLAANRPVAEALDAGDG